MWPISDAMAEPVDIRPLHPVWPSRPAGERRPEPTREERRRRREQEQPSDQDDADKGDGTHVDEYA